MTTFHTAPPTAATMGAPAFDRVVVVEPGVRAVAHLNVTGTLPLFATHFPRYPVLPGVLLIESALALARLAAGEPGLRLRHATRLRFRRFVVPGDQVELTVTALADEDGHAAPNRWRFEALVAGEPAASIASLTVA